MLSIQTNPSEVKKELSSSLESYLAGAVKFIGNVTKFEAEDKAFDFADKKDFSKFTDNQFLAEKAIEEKEKELKLAAKKYGLQEKANYFFDARPMDNNENTAFKRNLGVALLTGAATMSAALADSPEVAVGLGLAGAALSVTMTTGRFLSKAETPAEKKSVAEYAEIKHAQLALKQLKKKVMPEESISYVPRVRTAGAKTDWSGEKNSTSSKWFIADLKSKNGR